MKRIVLHPKFDKDFKNCIRLYPNFLEEYEDSVHLFLNSDKSINDHELVKRNLKGLRAFSITDDIRVIYQETRDAYIFFRVGRHEDVY